MSLMPILGKARFACMANLTILVTILINYALCQLVYIYTYPAYIQMVFYISKIRLTITIRCFPLSQFETARVVWSWHTQDPTGPDSITRHVSQGSTSLNLLGGQPKEREDPPDADTYVVTAGNV